MQKAAKRIKWRRRGRERKKATHSHLDGSINVLVLRWWLRASFPIRRSCCTSSVLGFITTYLFYIFPSVRRQIPETLSAAPLRGFSNAGFYERTRESSTSSSSCFQFRRIVLIRASGDFSRSIRLQCCVHCAVDDVLRFFDFLMTGC